MEKLNKTVEKTGVYLIIHNIVIMNINNIGVYAINNLFNGKRYIGSTVSSFSKRWNNHKSLLRHNKHRNKHLQYAWNKYGESNFSFEILEETTNSIDTRDCEQRWLDEYFDNGLLYNNVKKAIVPNDEHRINLSDSQIIRFKSEEAKLKISQGNKGKKVTDEVKKRLSLAHTGKKLSQETKQKLSETHKGDKNYNFGKTLSDETRQKIGDGNRGIVKSEAQRLNMSMSHKGKPWSDARRQAQEARKFLKEINN